MVFQRPGTPKIEVEIRVGGTRLQQVSSFKYLGFIVIPSLSFMAHIARAVEKARAAAQVTSQLIRRLAINDLKRMGVYFQCFVESQLYCLELLPNSIAGHISSLRSLFVRSLFDLPRATSHELAVVLFDLPPIEAVIVRRKLRFWGSVTRHVFPFVCDATVIDRRALLNSPLGWHHGAFNSLRSVLGSVSTLDADIGVLLAQAVSVFSDRDYNFFYIKECVDSDTLSFFRLFADPTVLDSFHLLLESMPFSQRRLLILFSCSLLMYRFCHIPCEFCPLCGRRWLWDHFFVCQRLDVISFSSSRDSVLESVKTHIEHGQWEALLHFIRFYLLEWCDILSTAVFPRDVIDDLCL
jgi:hypothetical protein